VIEARLMRGRTLVLLIVGALVAAGGVYLVLALRSSNPGITSTVDAQAQQADEPDPKLRGKRPVVPPRVAPQSGGSGDGSANADAGLPRPRVDLRGIGLRDGGVPAASDPPVGTSLDPGADPGVDEEPTDAAVRLKGR
jgi:hypothetical protein